MISLSITILATAAIAQSFRPHVYPPGLEEITGFDWNSLLASASLRWTSCYQSYECARLQVPLDWKNSSNPNKVAIALARVPAVVPYDHPSFGGSILINPGGPGGSGVDELIWSGYRIRDIVDSEDKHFEIIGFDPRGVHHTTPAVSCFSTNWDREVWLYRNWAIGQLDTSANALDVKWALYESLAELCISSSIGRFEDGTNMRQFVSTALTARDMVAIIDALQEEQTAALDIHGEISSLQQQPLEDKQRALLNYIGYSYGTYLGNTFASLFPNRIGSMNLDGNVDPLDYAATGWLSNLFDNERTWHWFHYSCFKAGETCALVDANTTSLFDLQKKTSKLLMQLADNPLAIVHDGIPDLVTYSDLTNLIHGASYAPLHFWPDVAQVMSDLLKGNGTSIVKYLKSLHIPQTPKPTNSNSLEDNELDILKLKNDSLPYPPDYPGGLEAAISILCGDGDSISSLTKKDWGVRLAHLKNQSVIAAPFWAAIPFACQHWTPELRPFSRNRFTGPFQSKLADYDKRGSPILFIGNTADPVTPLRNAIENSKHHEGSRVLTQDSPGHCSLLNPSRCTLEAIRLFFANGTLPEEGKVCMVDRSPWDTV